MGGNNLGFDIKCVDLIIGSGGSNLLECLIVDGPIIMNCGGNFYTTCLV